MRLTQGHRIEQRQEIRIGQGQAQRLSARIALLEGLRGEKYVPSGTCPDCGHKLSRAEILRGFNDSPTDLTTGCPKCRRRFDPQLAIEYLAGRVEYRFYCPSQTLFALRIFAGDPPEKIKEENPSLYRSAHTHYGTLKNAFARIGVEYSFDEIPAWREKILPFLGELPDTAIAECCGQKTADIRTIRKSLRIKAYNRKRK